MALIDQQDVRRLFEGLVTVLAERDPGRLTATFQVAELYQHVLPYRTYRSRLGFDTNQDYEAALLGLLAGIGGFASVEPVEAQDALAAEAASPNPDAGLFREYAGARVWLHTGRVREVLDRSASYAPPETPAAAPAGEESARPPVFLLEREAQGPARPAPPADALARLGRCRACGKPLPDDRPAAFCPWCGVSAGPASCAQCGEQLDDAWRYCPRCGAERRR
ncbi:MAG TPA: zinc ribbon domain-containing protein [Gemmatimonadales bacterium]|nr:zinc ribbon domain-containing protein [Gemmatimonadales bacterium]